MQFFLSSYYFLSLRSKCFLTHFVLRQPQSLFFPTGCTEFQPDIHMGLSLVHSTFHWSALFFEREDGHKKLLHLADYIRHQLVSLQCCAFR